MSKSTKCFILILIIGTAFYILRMRPQHIRKNYESVLLKISNNEYIVEMEIQGKTTRDKLFSNRFTFEGTLEVDTQKEVFKNIIQPGELYLTMDKDFNNLYNGTLRFPPIEKPSDLKRVARLTCSSDFEKIHINGAKHLGFEIFVKTSPTNPEIISQ